MFKGDLMWKIPLVLILVAAAIGFWAHKGLNLGLDLQGGLHLILQVETDKVIENELVRTKDGLALEFKKERLKVSSIAVELPQSLKITAASSADKDAIQAYIKKELENFEESGLLSMGNSFTITLKDNLISYWKENAVKQALLTIRNRIDEYGVAEPIIQRQGKDRIIIELPGVKDLQRAIDLIGRTAELRFQLVKDMAASKEELLKR